MKTTEEIDEDILKVTIEIKERFPELSKYIAEMPVTISYAPGSGVSIASLKEYLNSLEELLKKYAEEHNRTTKLAS